MMFGLVAVKNAGFTVFWYLTPKIITLIILALIASIPLKEVFENTYKAVENTYLEFIGKNLYLIVIFVISIMCVMTSTYNSFIYFKF
ncbi:hypothetical protein [Clostridium neonatale]|uniref:hypothetical protein n=1 Tax=Clostridium neonatale TaxID=137838 RepID=UPI00397B7F10